jgi:hypothetical protein
MTNDQKLSSIEASFKMENLPFDSASGQTLKKLL